METYCLHILLYATCAYDLSDVQLNELNACWNFVYRRIFGFNKWESVREFIAGLGRLNFCSIRDQLCLKFIKFGFVSNNLIFKALIKRFYLSDACLKLRNRNNVMVSVQYLSVNRRRALVNEAFLNTV